VKRIHGRDPLGPGQDSPDGRPRSQCPTQGMSMSSVSRLALFVAITSAVVASVASLAVASTQTIALATGAAGVSPVLTLSALALPSGSPGQQMPGTCAHRKPTGIVNLGSIPPRGAPGSMSPRGVGTLAMAGRDSHAVPSAPPALPCCPVSRKSLQRPRSPGVAAPTLTGQPSARAAGEPARRVRWCI
jgi:hypothetical protein